MKTNRQLLDELKELIGSEAAMSRLHSWLLRTVRVEKKRKDLPGEPNDFLQQVQEIVKDLNLKTGLGYRWQSKETQSLIRSRLNDGFTVEDFKKVHSVKSSLWLGTDNQSFLRPSTLYRASKFEGYLQEFNLRKIDKKKKTYKSQFPKLPNEEILASEAKSKVDAIINNINKKVKI